MALLKLETLSACILLILTSGSQPIMEKELYRPAQAPPPTRMDLLTVSSGTTAMERRSKSMPEGNPLELQLKIMTTSFCITFTNISG